MSEKQHTSVAIIERGEMTPQVHPLAMVQQAVERGLDPETISKLMDLADRHAATEARKAYSRALVALKADLPTVIGRDKTVSFGNTRYTHSSLGKVMESITEPLTLHGFSLAWEPSTAGNQVSVTCRLTHAAGHSEATTLTAPADTKGSKSEAQGVMSTITMLERYSALALLGIATADMQEPHGETDKDHVDSAANMKAMAAAVKAGHKKTDVEKQIGKPVQEWTDADLGKVAELFDGPKVAEALAVIDKAQSVAELDEVGKGIKGLGLTGRSRDRVLAHFKEARAKLS